MYTFIYFLLALTVADISSVNGDVFGFQSLSCVSFSERKNVSSLLKLKIVLSKNVTSALGCLMSSVRNSSILAPQWAMVSGQVGMTSLQCHLFMFMSLSTDTDVNVWEIIKANKAPFCRVYFTKGTSCESSQLYGWKVLHTVVWSSDLDSWVNCDNVKDGGGWIVIQRRQDGSVDFYRGWQDYKSGFGSLTGEFWMGLDNMHRLLASKNYQIRFDMTKNNGEQYYAIYDHFSISDESSGYVLSVGSYSGNAGDSFSSHNGRPFETKDKLRKSAPNCPALYRGAWWYKSCHSTNPNGIYGSVAFGQGINWVSITPAYRESLAFFEMKIKR